MLPQLSCLEASAPAAAQAIPADKVVVPIPADFVMAESVHQLMRELTALVYKHGDERTKARASICATYMRCIHDDFYTARDMLLMSHLQVHCLSLLAWLKGPSVVRPASPGELRD